MNSYKDFYKILGVSRNASDKEIRAAYKKLALKLHPDRNKNNPQAGKDFSDVNQAYEVLKNPEKKRRYDAGTYDGAEFNNRHNYQSQENHFFRGNREDIFETIFQSFFGEFTKGSRGFNFGNPLLVSDINGENIVIEINVSIKELFSTCQKNIKYFREVRCSQCSGKKYSNLEKCFKCHGRGFMETNFGFTVLQQPCNACNGSCYSKAIKCNACKATGKKQILESKNIIVGNKLINNLKITGFGNCGLGNGKDGDLIIKLVVLNGKFFYLKNYDLYINIPVSTAESLVGCNFYLTIPSGEKVYVEIPKNVQHHEYIIIPNKGLKSGIFSLGRLVIIVELDHSYVSLNELTSPRRLNMLSELENGYF